MQNYIYCPVCAGILKLKAVENKVRNYCPNCGFVHYVNPLPATVAIAENNNSILLIKRGMPPARGAWTLPSGFMEAGESPEEGCLRELKEETGMNGEIIRLINVYHDYSEIYGDVLNIIYHVKLEEGNPVPGDDADAVKMVALNEINDLVFKCFNLGFNEFKNNL